jgi:hypothetical protein
MLRCKNATPCRLIPHVGFRAESLVPAGDARFALSLLQRLRYNQAVICIQVFRFPFWEEGHER